MRAFLCNTQFFLYCWQWHVAHQYMQNTLLHLDCNDDYMMVPQCYIIQTLSIVFSCISAMVRPCPRGSLCDSIWNWVKNNNNNAIIIAAAAVVVVVVCNLYSMMVVVVTKMIDDDSDDHMVLMSCHTLMIQKICCYLQIYLVMIFWSERHNGDVRRSWGAKFVWHWEGNVYCFLRHFETWGMNNSCFVI